MRSRAIGNHGRRGVANALPWLLIGSLACAACSKPPEGEAPATSRTAPVAEANTCVGPYSTYLDLPDGSNEPPEGWERVFELSQAFPDTAPGAESYPWMEFDPFSTEDPKERWDQSYAYIHALYGYILEGNVGLGDSVEDDFTLCSNPVRAWYHVPWMNADPLKGREFVHGLTQELTASPGKFAPEQTDWEQAWAVGFYNGRGAAPLTEIFTADGTVNTEPGDLRFPDGAVVGKVLMTEADPSSVPFLEGSPEWTANIHASALCNCTGPECETHQWDDPPCQRGISTVRFVQFDVAVRDDRAETGWVFGTFTYNAAQENSNPWLRVVPVGLMWGNDPGVRPEFDAQGNLIEPSDPARIQEGVTFVSLLPEQFQERDMGCAGRLDGPVDNPRSSCMSCHGTASIPRVIDGKVTMPHIMDFANQCTAGPEGEAADAKYFANVASGDRFDPEFASADYSLQVSEALHQYLTAQQLTKGMTLGKSAPRRPRR